MTRFTGTEPYLILGITRTLGWRDLSPFVESLAKTGYQGHVAFFVDATDEDTRSQLRSFGVRLVEFRESRFRIPFSGRTLNTFRFFRYLFLPVIWALDLIGRSKQTPTWFIERFYHIVQSRNFMYRRLLEREYADVRRVLLCDLRDVVFQSHPFGDGDRQGIDAFLEDTSVCIAAEKKFNAMWIEDLFGSKVLAEIGANPISCAGTVIGDRTSILEYLALQCTWLASPRNRRRGGHTGPDQAIHNVVVWKGIVKNIRVHRNFEGAVLTLGLSTNIAGNVLSNGAIVGQNGRLVPIVHQYDRDPDLMQGLFRSLGL